MNLVNYIPFYASEYCIELLRVNNFTLKIKNNRRTKYGDYSFNPTNNTHTITVNKGLNKFLFLITYLHEVAHYLAFQECDRNIFPHGNEWKVRFIRLVKPVLTPKIFPEILISKINNHLINPKSSIVYDYELYVLLRKYDNKTITFLYEISQNDLFYFRENVFRKGILRRTKFICEKLESKKQYLISKSAEVKPFQQ